MEVELQGWEELKRNLDQLPARAQKNILRGMVRAEAKHIADAIKDRAPVLKPQTINPHERYAGQLRDAVTAVSLNPSATPGAVAAGVRIRGSREALQQTIKAGRALGKGKLKGAARALAKAIADGYFWRWVEFGSPHNEPPNPFVRSGWDAEKTGSLGRMAQYCRKRLDRLVRD